MQKKGLILLALAGILLQRPGYSQQTQPTPNPHGRSTGAEVGNTPSPNDMYCSGFITPEKISDKIFVAAGHYSPDQSRFAGAADTIFLHGAGMKPGDRYQI
ncbi:MAG TPA: hypothetical protein VE133_12800, partial [Candidatus Sulfotelmatobacter sp.]|nr:hypothetical protein [Candidatus Sulfotelmatobacter sp.]